MKRSKVRPKSLRIDVIISRIGPCNEGNKVGQGDGDRGDSLRG